MKTDIPLWLLDNLLQKFDAAFDEFGGTRGLDNRYLQWCVDLGIAEPPVEELRWDADQHEEGDKYILVTRRTMLGEYIHSWIDNKRFDGDYTINWNAPLSSFINDFEAMKARVELPEKYKELSMKYGG